MPVATESEDIDYAVECRTRTRTAVLRGVMRLEHHVAHERVFAAIQRDLDATGIEPYTIDVSAVVFMNSSVLRALASLVLSAKRTRRSLTILGQHTVPWQERTLGSLSALYEDLQIRLEPRSIPPASVTPTLRRDQEVWTLETPGGRTLRFKDSKGFAYLERLLGQPAQDVHVLELIGAEAAGDAGPILDERAKSQYRDRLTELGGELTEAERFHDGARATSLREEIDALTHELAGAVGFGGRDRRAASDVQRVRINVQRCLKDALDRVAEADPALGRYLAATVKTGTYCSFKPL
jgi:hypothetical protein